MFRYPIKDNLKDSIEEASNSSFSIHLFRINFKFTVLQLISQGRVIVPNHMVQNSVSTSYIKEGYCI